MSYIFHKKGVLVFESSVISEDDAMGIAIDAGAEDVISEDDSVVVYTSPDDFENVLKAFDDKGIAHVSAEVTMVPDTYQEVSADRVDKILALVEKLEDFDDVQAVYTNLKIPDDYQA